jgi:predicted ribonuclease YlaK
LTLGSGDLPGQAANVARVGLPLKFGAAPEQVRSELDDIKPDARTADAAQKPIRQIDEFGRRGDTFAGVPLAGKLSMREVPQSSDMSAPLPWLRADTPDDVIVASALEILMRDLRGRVAVLASDRNVRNKARLAGLATIATGQL